MRRHTITVEEISLDVPRVDLASSSGGESRKRMTANLRGCFFVTDHGVEVYAGTDLEKAVEAYNAAR